MNTLNRVAMLAASSMLLAFSAVPPVSATAHCADIATPATGVHAAMVPAASPAAHHAELRPEQLYIDMMIPHHASIIALAEAALPSLRDDRLREMAAAIVATQEAEIAELRELRAAHFGSPNPAPLDDAMLAGVHSLMPEDAAGEHAMDGPQPTMATLMNSAALITTFCQAADPDLAFASLTMAHHRMAVDSSRGLLEMTQDKDLRDLAERVIAAQAAEIATLQLVLSERTVASLTP